MESTCEPTDNSVLLDSLVVRRCVSLIKQKISVALVQQAVSKEFGDAIQLLHNKTCIALSIQRKNSRMNSFLVIESLRKQDNYLWVKNTESESEIRVRRKEDMELNLQLILSKIVLRFKQVRELYIFPGIKDFRRHHLKYSDEAQMMFSIFAQMSEVLKIRRLGLRGFFGGPEFYLLMEKSASSLREIAFLNLDIAAPYMAVAEECFIAVTQCKSLQTIHIEPIIEGILENLCACLETLKIKRVRSSRTAFSKENFLPVLPDKFFRTMITNKNFRCLMLTESPSFYCSSAAGLELLSQLHCVQIQIRDKELDEDNGVKEDILKILQALHPDGYLNVVFTIDTYYPSLYEYDVEIPSLCESVVNMFNVLLELSDHTGKKCRLDLLDNRLQARFLRSRWHLSEFVYVIKKMTMYGTFKNLIVEHCSKYRIVLRMRNARLFLSSLNPFKLLRLLGEF